MKRLAPAFFLVLASCAASVPAPKGDASRFELTVLTTRTDARKSHVTDDSPAVTSESETTLFGRVESSGGGAAVTFYADSILHHSLRPFAFQTFMSADTMYYRSSTGTSTINHKEAVYDSMLSCLFGGAALRVTRDRSGAPKDADHVNSRCQSGEYERINAPVTLCAFLVRTPDDGDRWHDRKPLPSFSGVGFHPEIDWLFRAARTTDSESTVTVTVAADTTIEDYETVMKNGEEIVVVRDRIRIGGTMSIDRSTGLPRLAELRVGESLRLIRPHASGMVVTREGHYTIRFTLPD
jgi:hypothetical protein